MTDDERQKLVERLRSDQCQYCDCRQCTSDRIVADELERLAAENAELRATIEMLDNLNSLTSFWRRKQEGKAGRDG